MTNPYLTHSGFMQILMAGQLIRDCLKVTVVICMNAYDSVNIQVFDNAAQHLTI